MTRHYVLAITGGSGAAYAVRLLEAMCASGHQVHLVISAAGGQVLKTELGVDVDPQRLDARTLLFDAEQIAANEALGVMLSPRRLIDSPDDAAGRVRCYAAGDLMAPIASGSFVTAGMVVCPCSGGTLSGIAHAASANLIHRAADVHLKERRKLVLVPRETPLSTIQLDNMKRVAEAGAVVLPAMPGFYHGVRGVGDLVDFVVARICDQLGVEHRLMRRWGE